ncbi:hypothetical protein ACE1CD_02625 [Aerosakkonema sp. BLCC-F183]|uniref:hypothetical protein n=1 Tax=Aerosakkonema sp. BLCC-F183 TaxID=3342834 RepID=UPI0035B6EF5D
MSNNQIVTIQLPKEDSDREGIIIPRQNSHQFVISQFTNSPADERGRKLGAKLQILRGHRRQADYLARLRKL